MPQPRVLFVEDEELIRMILTETMIEAGLEVTEAANGEEAMQLLEERRFDLLLTDVHMPGRFNGVDIARQVRALWPAVPVVFVTGRPDTLRAFGTPGPRDRSVLKPYKPSDVLTAIQASLAEGF
jgi:CheY-like chemotaxis protein